MVLSIISKYMKAIKKYLIVPDINRIFLLEKESPTRKDSDNKEGVYKDGFHIMFPDLCVYYKIRHLIRYQVVEDCKNDGTFDEFNQSVDKIIDKAVVSSNGWIMHGSRKPSSLGYNVTEIWNSDLDKFDGIYPVDKLISILSIQKSRYTKKKATELTGDFVDSDIDAECSKKGLSDIKSDIHYDITTNKEDEIRRATRFVGMLSDERADSYLEWKYVGWALHNIDKINMKGVYIEFSKRCPKKFKEEECEKEWTSTRTPSHGKLLTIRSLAFWAKQDSPKEYEAFMKEEFKLLLSNSLSGDHTNIAKAVHGKYGEKFVCSSISKNIWWEFKNHHWERIEEGYTLRNLLADEFVNEYNMAISDISLRATKVTGIERERLYSDRSKLDKIVSSLMNGSFKNQIMSECKSLFYDGRFAEKLDSNLFLIGFNNGVYDLQSEIFREGRPDDFITLSTKQDYIKFSTKNPYWSKIDNFFKQVLPDEEIRKYFLLAICSCVCGENREEKLYTCTASGSNGKSNTFTLIQSALGDYYMPADISIITQKRNASNAASPEKVRMKGRRCGVFQEPDKEEKMRTGSMKELTGNDKIQVRDLFKGSDDMIEFVPQIKFFMACNDLPEVNSIDDGTWRRIRVIHFGSKFVDNPTKPNEFPIDTTLKTRMPDWSQCFISYLINLYVNTYSKMKYLKEPIKVLASTNQYKNDNNFYSEFVNDLLTITDNGKDKLKCDLIFGEFKSWYGSAYSNCKLPKRPEFLKQMNTLLGDRDRRGFYYKVKLAPNDDSDNDNDNDNIISV